MLHNPRCSKSRQTLALLEGKSIKLNIIEYLTNPPTSSDLRLVVELLGVRPKDIVRTKEDEFRSSDIDLEDDEAVLSLLERQPKLIERPIVWTDTKAVIARPPENVEDLF